MLESLKTKITHLWLYFSTYERWWLFTIISLSVLISIYFPEEEANGVSGRLIGILYLANIFFNALCELLISKQSKWNFIVSLLVEATEIAIPLFIMKARWATVAVTLLFWIPIDIISFINWHRHPDQEQNELTQVRKLSGLAEVLTITGIVVWTFAIGYWTSNLNITTDFFGGNKLVETWVAYLDACVSAVGIANGMFILLRYREQWLAWYLSATLETIINILSGQYVLLVLKAGYFTNTTYGYIKWTRYIKAHQEKISKQEKLTESTAVS